MTAPYGGILPLLHRALLADGPQENRTMSANDHRPPREAVEASQVASHIPAAALDRAIAANNDYVAARDALTDAIDASCHAAEDFAAALERGRRTTDALIAAIKTRQAAADAGHRVDDRRPGDRTGLSGAVAAPRGENPRRLRVLCEVREGYLYMKAVGEFDPVTARKVFSQWTEEAPRHRLNRVLCDLTQLAGSPPNPSSLIAQFDPGERAVALPPGGMRLAILAAPRQLVEGADGEDGMFKEGVMVRVTSDLQGALAWLAAAPGDRTDAGGGSP